MILSNRRWRAPDRPVPIDSDFVNGDFVDISLLRSYHYMNSKRRLTTEEHNFYHFTGFNLLTVQSTIISYNLQMFPSVKYFFAGKKMSY